ncbi:MAG: LysM peptidoglycan-binding domain-containing protein [Deltaproteobacteria bacterium]|nr:MAG: LysM peptidoglycan-binding domain-containing protein [Deltaproteobacteria bacterium]
METRRNRMMRGVIAAALAVIVSVSLMVPRSGAEENAVEVREGDTLWEISKRLWADGYCWSGLLWKNLGVDDPDVISPGQLISLPPECVRFPAPVEGQEGVYRVEARTTLREIAVEHFDSPEAEPLLARMNLHIDPDEPLEPGTLVYIELPREFGSHLESLGIIPEMPRPVEKPSLVEEEVVYPTEVSPPVALPPSVEEEAVSPEVEEEAVSPEVEVEEAPVPAFVTEVPREEGWPRKKLALGAGAASLASFGAAYYFHVKAEDSYSRFKSEVDRGEDIEAVRELESETERYDNLSRTFQWVGGGLAVTGLVIYLWPSRGKPRTAFFEGEESFSVNFEVTPAEVKAVVLLRIP